MWTLVPNFSIIEPNGNILQNHELQVALPTITKSSHHEVCFDDLKAGLPKFRVVNKANNCSTLFNEIPTEQLIVFGETCVFDNSAKDMVHFCFDQQLPSASLMKIGAGLWILCGLNDSVESIDGSMVCNRQLLPFSNVLSINGKVVKHLIETTPPSQLTRIAPLSSVLYSNSVFSPTTQRLSSLKSAAVEVASLPQHPPITTSIAVALPNPPTTIADTPDDEEASNISSSIWPLIAFVVFGILVNLVCSYSVLWWLFNQMGWIWINVEKMLGLCLQNRRQLITDDDNVSYDIV